MVSILSLSDLRRADLPRAGGKAANLGELIAAGKRAPLVGDIYIAPDVVRAQAKAVGVAALDDAQRNLDHTVLRAPISGTATQVDNIQLGRFVQPGQQADDLFAVGLQRDVRPALASAVGRPRTALSAM